MVQLCLGTPKSTLESHPSLLPLLRLGLYPSSPQHVLVPAQCFLSPIKFPPSSHSFLCAAVALTAYNPQSASHPSSVPLYKLSPTDIKPTDFSPLKLISYC